MRRRATESTPGYPQRVAPTDLDSPGASSRLSRIAIAVDFGGTKVAAAVVDEAGTVLEGSKVRAPTGGDAGSEEVAASVRSVVRSAAEHARTDGREIAGIGIGSAGPVDTRAGTASPLNVPSWRNYPLPDLVAATAAPLVGELSVTLRVDGEAIALAEHWIGAARGTTAMIGMVVSTGIGGGIVAAGRTFPGLSGNAGHIGHIAVPGAHERCACGMTGCVEAVASGPRSVAWAREHGWTGATGEELGEACRNGDEIALRAAHRSADAVGRAIAGAAALLDVEIVTVGGGFSRVIPDYIDRVATPLAQSDFPYVRDVRVVPSGLSGNGPLIGAGAFALLPERLG